MFHTYLRNEDSPVPLIPRRSFSSDCLPNEEVKKKKVELVLSTRSADLPKRRQRNNETVLIPLSRIVRVSSGARINRVGTAPVPIDDPKIFSPSKESENSIPLNQLFPTIVMESPREIKEEAPLMKPFKEITLKEAPNPEEEFLRRITSVAATLEKITAEQKSVSCWQSFINFLRSVVLSDEEFDSEIDSDNHILYWHNNERPISAITKSPRKYADYVVACPVSVEINS